MKNITRNMISNKPVIKVGYCTMQMILNYFERIGYNRGVYGWNCDIYDFGRAYIVTGYRTLHIPGKYASYEMTKAFDDAAAKIRNENHDKTYDQVKSLLAEKMSEFIAACL